MDKVQSSLTIGKLFQTVILSNLRTGNVICTSINNAFLACTLQIIRLAFVQAIYSRQLYGRPASRTDRFELPVYRLKESFVEFLLILNSPHPLNSTHHDDRPGKRERRAIHPHNVQIYTYTAQNRFPVCVP